MSGWPHTRFLSLHKPNGQKRNRRPGVIQSGGSLVCRL